MVNVRQGWVGPLSSRRYEPAGRGRRVENQCAQFGEDWAVHGGQMSATVSYRDGAWAENEGSSGISSLCVESLSIFSAGVPSVSQVSTIWVLYCPLTHKGWGSRELPRKA